MKRLILFLALALPLAAQPNADPTEHIQKLVTLKYADPGAVIRLLQDFGVDRRSDDSLKVIALSGRRASVMVAEEAIRQLDVPSAGHKDIDLTVYFVVASESNMPATDGNPIPADLQSTVTALKSTFAFKYYALMDALSLRSRSGVGAQTSGVLSGNRITQFALGSSTIEPDSMIRLDRLRAGLRTPITDRDGKVNYIDTGINTDVVDVKEGQKLVVGRGNRQWPRSRTVSGADRQGGRVTAPSLSRNPRAQLASRHALVETRAQQVVRESLQLRFGALLMRLRATHRAGLQHRPLIGQRIRARLPLARVQLLQAEETIEIQLQLPLLQLQPVARGAMRKAAVEQPRRFFEQRLHVQVTDFAIRFGGRKAESALDRRYRGQACGRDAIHSNT